MHLPEEFMGLLNTVTNKRARFVIDTILEKGYCSTEDLKKEGYEHAPRAARDVREQGIPLDTFTIKDSHGKYIAAYRFGDWETAKNSNPLAKASGRTHITEKLKNALIEKYGARCHLYSEEYPARLLQPDHRIPFEIGGNPVNMLDTNYFMLLSPSANRDKSWACEHCVNWVEKNIDMCRTCYYAYPEDYQHIAGETEKKLNLVFHGKDLDLYNQIVEQAKLHHISNQSAAKRMIEYYQKVSNNTDLDYGKNSQ